MKISLKAIVISAAALAGLASAQAQADTIADWTFETSQPTTAGPFAPEIGSGAATGFHAGGTTYSSPAGNGSAHSFSSTTWAVGDYYQFSVNTTGFTSLGLSWDQTSSNTGPRDFTLSYSTDGTNFTSLTTYAVLANGLAPNASWNGTTSSAAYTFTQDLSSLLGLNNQPVVFFRLTDASTVAVNSPNPVAATGTDRVDNFIVTGTASVSSVPVPAAAWLLVSGLLGLTGLRRRNLSA